MLRRTCSQSWKDLGNNKYRSPRYRLLHTGLLYVDKRTHPIQMSSPFCHQIAKSSILESEQHMKRVTYFRLILLYQSIIKILFIFIYNNIIYLLFYNLHQILFIMRKT